MGKILQHLLLVYLFLLSCFNLSAQSEKRRELIKPEQKINNVSGSPSKKSETVTDENQSQKSGVNAGLNKPKENIVPTDAKISTVSEVENKYVPAVKKDDVLRKAKTPEQLNKSADENNTENINAPLFPDFQVTAIKEEPYENKQELKESSSQQLQKLERIPADELQAEGVSQNNQMTISPSKRKYLEGIVTELEKEIKAGKRTSVETHAKKKELDDLKKLLAQ